MKVFKNFMFNIQKLLEKFSKDISLNNETVFKIIEIIKKQTNIDCSKEAIQIKDNILFLKLSPIYKNKIFIYKKNILEELSQNISIKILDIK